MKKRTLLVLILVLYSIFNHGQEKILSDYFESYLESMDEQNIDSDELLILWQDIIQRINNPIEINIATYETLQELNFLSHSQIKDLLFYREQVGKIYTIYELGTLASINKSTLDLLVLFLTVEDQYVSPEIAKTRASKSQILLRYRTQFPRSTGLLSELDEKSQYVGDANQYYFLYKGVISDSFTAGFVMEKDIGEEFWNRSSKQPEYYAGFVEYNKKDGILEKVILGDYHLRLGQGLSFWSGGSSSKPTSPNQNQKFNQGFRSYTSTNENQYFRGVAGTIRWNQFQISFLGSSKLRDANLSFDSEDRPAAFTSFQNSGLHRSISELEDRNSVRETWYGAMGEFRTTWFSVGAYYMRGNWSLPSVPKLSYPLVSKHEGEHLNLNGMHYQFGKSGIQAFGEVASNLDENFSWMNGVVANLHPRLDASVLVRNYSPTFISLYGNTFSEQSSPKNEKGVCVSVAFYPIKSLKINSYIDFFSYPKPTSRVFSSSKGAEFMCIAEYDINQKGSLLARVKQEKKEENGDLIHGVYSLVTRCRTEYRTQLSYDLAEQLRIKTRFEYVAYHKQSVSSTGILGYLDLTWRGASIPGVIGFRVSYFETDDYNTRIYSYENDVLYQFALPALYGNGLKSYLNFKYSLGEHFTIYSKASFMHRFDTDVIGSGNDETLGSDRWEVKAMIRFKF